MAEPEEHVRAAFGLADIAGVRLGGRDGRVWRYGDAVIKPVGHPVDAAWSAGVFDALRVNGIRIPRPVRSLDGRWVVGGWCAQRYVSGRPAARYTDMIETSFLLDNALADVPKPRFLRSRDGMIATADRLAWGEKADGESELGPGRGAGLWRRLAHDREPVATADQVIHGDVFGNVLFAGSAPPAVVGFEPLWRPASFAAAVVAVDCVAWGGAPAGLLQQWSHLSDWDELVRRAVLFRLALSLLHPRRTPMSLDRIAAVAEVVRDR